ncbi:MULTISPECIES: gephyrin-like molybdotransferase Glp [Okeania]|uniref:Molybdopterin molybdenumtransferase n=2 Tax=Okeania TaxID=1458928 RepID=A0A3N6Q119_9CYAN|nr:MULTISPECIES: gephyrin-like molybdotransferase Glp [Okeania]NET17179.1 molybdopterin molybdotransferase MoeA [Okeania sp. SIO1H6]NEP76155.1 molybdopterin molybdotransferase MoeA [Okeania sp. SIO2G5]NEP97314.1 molybdopterin molybdotransferase MoeA [Okeania sp. SIO2F5]NEQ95056.1 molybdopterin molybdotransferase MoeA [Okeania sp. SIO2G4]NES78770.1 molybdopterin molybdotransferase MoeA [Okeania sp. SIO1H4]
MLPVDQAESIILNLVQPLNTQRDVETVDLLTASGRILATPVTSKVDFPHWDNSAMDGYAVKFTDVKNSSPENPIALEIIEEIPAGYQPQQQIQPGQTARIFTGACMPKGSDTVVMQEVTQRQGNKVLIQKTPRPQEFVRYRGSFYTAGTPLLQPGIILGASEIAVLAALQCPEITVYRPPKVGILSTGNELVTPDQPLQPGQLVDSNQYALAVAVAQTGAEVIRLGIVPDEPEILKKTIAEAITSTDFLLSTGGVSVGDYDYVEDILTELGAEIQIHSVAVKPGKPLTVAKFADTQCVYFGLPGNPVSALVSFWRFVQPALKKLAGVQEAAWGPEFVTARSLQDLHSNGKRETYLWGQLKLGINGHEFQLAQGSHSSGNLINLAGSTGLAVIPLNETSIAVGESVQVLKIS